MLSAGPVMSFVGKNSEDFSLNSGVLAVWFHIQIIIVGIPSLQLVHVCEGGLNNLQSGGIGLTNPVIL